MLPNPYQQYKEQSLNTMSSGEILVKLFDESVKQLNVGHRAILARDFAKTNESLSKAQEIIDTLSLSLDMNYEISQQLRPMYTFLSQQIVQANMKKDASVIPAILPLVKELRDSFSEAQKLSRRPQQQVAMGGRAI